MKRLIRHARVLVTDGGKALIFRNEGDAFTPDLKLMRSHAQDVPPTREIGASRPPRTNDASGRRSAMDAPDYHQEAEDRFVAGIAAEMDRDFRAGEFENLVVAAPPVALGHYRKSVSSAVAKATVLEIDKDYTKQTAAEIGKAVAKALEGA